MSKAGRKAQRAANREAAAWKRRAARADRFDDGMRQLEERRKRYLSIRLWWEHVERLERLRQRRARGFQAEAPQTCQPPTPDVG